MMLARLGLQELQVLKVRLKRIPSRASQSGCGERAVFGAVHADVLGPRVSVNHQDEIRTLRQRPQARRHSRREGKERGKKREFRTGLCINRWSPDG